MRWGVLAVLLAGCGFRVAAVPGDDAPSDGGGGDGDAPDDAAVVSCDAPLTWADGRVPTATVHVAANAQPPHDGTVAQPYATVAQALAAAGPGTRILLAAGSYQPATLTDAHGTATAPLWIEGPTGGARAVFTGASGLHLVRPQYVVVQHLDFTGLSGRALNLDDGGDTGSNVAHHVVLRDLHVNSSPSTAIQLTGVTDVAIHDCSAMNVSKGVMLVGVQRAMVARLRVTNASNAAFQAAGGTADVELRQSVFENNTARVIWLGGSSTEQEFRPPLQPTGNAEARNIRVLANQLHEGNAAIVCSLCTDVVVGANRIWGDNFSYILRFVNEHGSIAGKTFVPAGGMRFISNAIEVNGNPFGVRMESGTDCSACAFDHNLWLEIDDPGDSTPVFPVPETNGIYGVPSGYDAAGNLCAGGNAIAAGVLVPGDPGTIGGACRPMPPSIGPNEPDGSC